MRNRFSCPTEPLLLLARQLSRRCPAPLAFADEIFCDFVHAPPLGCFDKVLLSDPLHFVQSLNVIALSLLFQADGLFLVIFLPASL